MYFKISWDEDFDSLMMHLWSKYGKALFTLDGIGEQMDLNKFSKNFFNNPHTTADVSVDANANVVSKTGIEYNFEMPKPLKRYNSYFLLWKEMRKVYGLEYANKVIESQLTGDIYINDFTDVSAPYCFNYSTYDIALNGLNGISKRLNVEAPKSLSTFLRQVEQFMVVAANSTLGATGFADLLIVASIFVKRIQETGKDGHVAISDVKTYAREKLTEFIYTVNWEFRGNQCVTEDTEVLTPSGFKNYYNLQVGDDIYTWKKGVLNVNKVEMVNVYDYVGEMHQYKGRDLSQVVTPNHRVLYCTGSNLITIAESHQIIDSLSPIYMPIALKNKNEDFPISDDNLAICVLILTDGHIDHQEGKAPRVVWAKSDTRYGIDRFNELMDRASIVPNHREQKSEFNSIVHVYQLSVDDSKKYVELLDGTKKKLPDWMFKLSARQAKLVIDLWSKTDGYAERLQLQADTVDVADGLQHVAMLAEYGSRQHTRLIGTNKTPTRYVKVFKRAKKATRPSKIQYKGKVWCPTTEDGVVIFRKNGVTFISGNSPFSNVSLYDDTFLDSLCPDYGADKATVKMLQQIYVEVMNAEMRRTPLTFPVTTACFAIDEARVIKDKAFLKFIADANREFGFINLYNGSTATLSSCCRLRSERKSEYFNSFGAGSTKIGCYDDKTEVLTSNGWKYFKDVNIESDKIFTMNDDRSVRFDVPTHYHEYDYCGDMIRFATKTVDLLVTPNHRMVKRNVKSEKLVFERADVLVDKQEFSIPTHSSLVIDHYDKFFEIPEYVIENRIYPALRIPYTTWAKFMGIYLSEGYCDPEGNKNSHGNERYRVTISQSKVNLENCRKIEELLDEIGIPYGYYGVNYELHHKSLCLYLRKFGNRYNKFIPTDLKNQPKEVLEVLWDWLLMGDGYTAKNGVEMYWSTSKQLISDIQDILARMGYTSGYSTIIKDSIMGDGRIIKTKNGCYRVVKYTKRNSIVRKNHGHMRKEPYRGKVYCLTVPTGRLFVRRNGKTCWSGNSLGVVTVNLPRAALKARGNYMDFYCNVHDLFVMAERINACKRRLVKKRIELGAAPLYTHGYMDLQKQYSTFGIVGVNEAVQLLGQDILTEKGQEIVEWLLRFINAWIEEAEKKEHTPHNCEQVPAESSAVKLAQKDAMLGYETGVPFYSNQFIPLVTKADMHDRLRLQGMFDSKLSGGAIAHINVGERIDNPDTLIALMEYAAKVGVVYWAINYHLNCCPNKHTWVGSEMCPSCGGIRESQITRVVGFFTTVKNWNPVRREHDWPNRKFYSCNEVSENEIH